MAMEIELKAHVGDPEALKSRLERLFSEGRAVHKYDAYYALPGNDMKVSKIRLRREGDGVTVTYKEKSVSNGIEVNGEREFTVSDEAAFLDVALSLGARKLAVKEKKGWVFLSGELTIELFEIPPLGWFIEIEKVIPVFSDAGVESARSEILSALDAAGIAREAVEPRFYLDMLLEAQRGVREAGE